MWLCWIPILTPSVDYPRRLNGFLDKQGGQASDEKCTFSLLLSDLRGDEKSTVEISPDLKNGHIILIEIDGIIDIEVEKCLSNGLIVFSFKNRFDTFASEEHAAKQVYVILKHIYHEHTHHHRDDDMLLLPETIGIGNEEELKKGIRGIVTQYVEKIISYHRSLRRSLIYSSRDADNILTEFNKGLGEMLYAKHFLDLNKGWLDPQYCDDNRLAFCSSSDSFRQILSVFSSRLGKKNVDIAYTVIILSVCIFFIGGISPFLKNAPVKNLFVHLFFLAVFLGSYWGITRPKK